MSWITSPEFKVGFLVIAVSSLIAVMAMKVAEGPGLMSGKSTYFFRADSAGGLILNSSVKMAGIKVGIIEKIELEDGRARVIFVVERGVRISDQAHVELRADGILGDKHVAVIPGAEMGQELPSGSEVPMSTGRGGIDDIMAQVSKAVSSIQTLVDTLNNAAKNGDQSTNVGRIMGNIEAITADLKQITGENKEGVRDIVARIRTITKNIDTYINEESLAHVNRALKNIDEVTGKINRGEGTLGRLINDESTIENINLAVENVNTFLGGAQKMETSVDFHSEFMTNDQNKSFLGVRVQPGLDRYYELAVISDTQGVVTEDGTDYTNTNGADSTTTLRKTRKNVFKITALFAKNFWDFTVKGGLIENTGGAGADYYILGNRDLRLSVEAFDFKNLQLRSFVRYNFMRGFYVIGGGDNLLAKNDRSAAAFMGAGIFITNDDLKTLVGKFSFSK